MYEAVTLFATALIIGVIGNLVGIGGGVLLMIILLFVFKISPVIASGLSLATILVSAMVGSVSNMKQKAINKGLFYTIAVFAGIGIFLGSVFAYFISTKPFELLFGFVSIGIGLFSLLATRRDRRRLTNMDMSFSAFSASEKEYIKNSTGNRKGINAISVIAGFVAGFFGIGIGGIVGTFLTAIKKMNPKVAFSTVLAAMIITSVLGSALHLLSIKAGSDMLEFLAALALGAAAGAYAGSYASSRIKSARLRFLQGYIIISIGIAALVLALLEA
ncbi:MAG: sulfite exporter TauE/SafE family protein [Candidatus Micrarchaeaceae archaeon]